MFGNRFRTATLAMFSFAASGLQVRAQTPNSPATIQTMPDASREFLEILRGAVAEGNYDGNINVSTATTFQKPDSEMIQKALTKFVEAGSVVPAVSAIGGSSAGVIEVRPSIILGQLSQVGTPKDFDRGPKNFMQGTPALLTLLDIMNKAKSKMDEADPRRDKVELIVNALHGELAKLECPKPVDTRQVSAGWAAKVCSDKTPGGPQ